MTIALWLLAIQGVIGAFGIIFGAIVANLAPTLADWWSQPTALVVAPAAVPELLRWVLAVMAAGASCRRLSATRM